MRLPIRWKLILAIVLPLLLIASVVMWFTFERINNYAMARTQQQVTDQARYFAARLNDRFARVAQVAQGTAGVLEILDTADIELFYQLLEANLEQDPLISGAAIVLEDTRSESQQTVIAPTVYRSNEGSVRGDMAGANNAVMERTWYRQVRDTGQARWSGPYRNGEAGDRLINTYAMPIYRNGHYAGMTMVDISLGNLDELIDFGNDRGHDFVIVNAHGQFISHPDPDMIWRGSVAVTAGQTDNPALQALAHELTSGGTGVIKVREPAVLQSEELHWVFYAPVAITGWGFAMAVPEREILGFLNSQFKVAAIGITLMIALVIVCVLIIGTSLTRPLTRLSRGVNELARGDLNMEIEGINSSDEIGDLARGFNSMVGRLRRHVYALTREVAARESWESEMKFAHQVQVSLMPAGSPAFPDRDELELCGVYRPARHVAGDFFDYFMLDDNRLFLIIADVSGKGMASALLMAVTRTIVRNQARSGKTPAEILGEANRLLIETNMPSLFVTMFIASYSIDSGEITYANAGHPRPFKICCDDKVTRFGDTTGTIVGMLEEAEFTEAHERLNPGDYLVLYTDGVTDARSPDGEFLGEDNFIDLLRTYIGKPVEEICEHIVDILQGYQGNSLKDDTTLLVLKRN